MNEIPPIVIAKIEEAQEKQLKELDLSHEWILSQGETNPLTTIPSRVFDLHHLEVLNLSNNWIQYIPHEIVNLQNLKILNLIDNWNVNRTNVNYDILSRLPNLNFLGLTWDVNDIIPEWLKIFLN